ncbi:MAG: hypothetical protein WC905_05260, partial [Patescibacteria group bacterium]
MAYENYNIDLGGLNLPVGSNDILKMLAEGLRESSPWAMNFADTVLRDLSAKFKQVKVTSTPIVVDGESISKDINKNIKDGLTKDIGKTVENIRKGIIDTSKNVSAGANKEQLNISSILGQTPKLNLMNRMRFQGLTNSLLDKIEKGLPEKIDFKNSGIGLSEIFRPPGILGDMWVSISKSRFNTWGKIQSNLLNKVKDASE